MGTIELETGARRAVNDTNEGLRTRLSGRVLPPLRPVAGELQALVLQRIGGGLATGEKRVGSG